MTLTIPLSTETESKLRQRAAALGKDVVEFVRETVEEKLASVHESQVAPPSRAAAWERWVAHMRQWAHENLTSGHVIDDSRESIYQGRGE